MYGRGGRSLTETWSSGTRTLHGMHVHGFPNCFLMNNAQAGFTASFPHILNEQAKHLAYVIHTAVERSATTVEVSAEAEQGWIDQCISKARQMGDFLESCTPGYYNNEGKPGERSAQDGFYGGGSPEFIRILEGWRAQGMLDGLEVR
jgi:cyclohexanone monooxygenase